MSLRKSFIALPLVAAAISMAALPSAHADDEPAATTAVATEKQEAPKPEGGPREGGPRQRGGGGPMANETPEQRQERMARMLQPYTDMLPDLSEEQKAHILVILEASGSEVRALRANVTLSPERRTEMLKKVRGFLPDHIRIALTDAQIAIYDAAIAEQAEAQAQMEKVGSVRTDESVEQMRERLLQGYETVIEELSIKQKTALLKILETSGEESAAVNTDTKLTAAQKQAALRKIHDQISTKVLPLLDAEQKETWKKAHLAKRP